MPVLSIFNLSKSMDHELPSELKLKFVNTVGFDSLDTSFYDISTLIPLLRELSTIITPPSEIKPIHILCIL